MAIGLGANVAGPLGPPEDTLRWAVGQLRELLREARVSSLHRTDPQHLLNQPRYCNQVATGLTTLGPHGLLDALYRLEVQGGRDRSREVRFGPRSLDLDILTFGSYVVAASDLHIPHPRMHRRSFVMEPLLELIPHGVDPRSRRTWISYRRGWTRVWTR